MVHMAHMLTLQNIHAKETMLIIFLLFYLPSSVHVMDNVNALN